MCLVLVGFLLVRIVFAQEASSSLVEGVDVLPDGELIVEDVGVGSEVVVDEVVGGYRDWETDRKSTRLNSSHRL